MGIDKRKERVLGYIRRYMLLTWVCTWVAVAIVAPYLFLAEPQLTRFITFTGYVLGSVSGLTLFVPLVRRHSAAAFYMVIAAGVLAVGIEAVGFIILFLNVPVIATWAAASAYRFWLPGAVIWFSGGIYFALARYFPEMLTIKLSLRPWRR